MNLITESLLEAFGPYMTPDLHDYLTVIGEMFDEVDLYAELGDDDGWSGLLDPDACPAVALPYLAQFMGERLPQGLNETMMREWVKDAPNLRRGTPRSIWTAAQRTLTGNRVVSMIERSGDPPYPEDYLTVTTYTDQTPFPDRVLEDLYNVVPADIDLNYTVLDGQNWAQLATDHASWDAVKADYANWFEVRAAATGITSWDRPRPIHGSGFTY